MKKVRLTLLLVAAFFSYAAAAQSKNDTLARQEEAIQKQEEAIAMQKKALDRQQHRVMQQQSLAKEQAEKAKKQSEKAKEQKEMRLAIQQEMIKDGLIRKDEHYELIINNKEMLINGRKQADAVHQKYIQMINSKRNKAFGDKEEWKIKQ